MLTLVALCCLSSTASAHTPDRLFVPLEVVAPVAKLMARTLRDQIDPTTLAKLLPSTAIGHTSQGRLLFPVRMVSSLGVHSRHHDLAWTVPEVIRGLEDAARYVRAVYPGGMDLVVGDLSRHRGGRFRPHATHQSGLDVDLRYYNTDAGPGDHELHYLGAWNFDAPRVWAFVEYLVTNDLVSDIFMDYRLQKILYRHARKLGRTDAYLAPILSWPHARRRQSAVVGHVRNHFNHMHVRFKAPTARLFGKLWTVREADLLNQRLDMVTLGRFEHRVRSGDTLGAIAEAHRVPLSDLLRWNKLRKTSRLKLGQTIVVIRHLEQTEEG